MQAGLPRLAQTGHLGADAASELYKRLSEVSEALTDGDDRKVRDKLRETAKKISKLREDGKLTGAGYQILASQLTQLAETLP
jgi:hypothetical protein